VSGAVDYAPEFRPAICSPCDQRFPEWYVIRYVSGKEVAFKRALDMIRLPYHLFDFQEKKHRKPAITKYWFPGYAFLQFDWGADFWQQLYQAPFFLEVINAPHFLPPKEMDRLVKILPDGKPKRRNAKVSEFDVGEDVKIVLGPLAGTTGKVLSAEPNYTVIITIIFGRPTQAKVSSRDLARII
jgi:transcription antitermination factor NusG